MDEMKKYECPDCGTVIDVAADAGAPTCEDCEVTMEPVAAGVEEGEEVLADSELEEEEDEDLE